MTGTIFKKSSEHRIVGMLLELAQALQTPPQTFVRFSPNLTSTATGALVFEVAQNEIPL
jgi:hypothetical protein